MAAGSTCTFDRWQKDVFFSAAEEVQESADILESVYRMWIRYRSGGFESEISDELLRELRTALGTAKWQLEEFEKAVNLSHERCPAEESTITRHRDFVAVIGNLVLLVEKELSDSLVGEGNQPFRWVQLNEEERDDLAIFLSTAPQMSREMKDKYDDHDMVPNQARTKPEHVVKVAAKEPSKSKIEVIVREEQLDGQRRTCSSPAIGDWKIVIAEGEDTDMKKVEAKSVKRSRASSLCGFLSSVESTAKSKWTRNSFPKAKSGEHLQLCQGVSNYLDLKGISRFAQGMNPLNERSRCCFTSYNGDAKVSTVQQPVGRAGGLQRHIQGSQNYMQFGRSLRFIIFLLLSIILIVPFILYST